jgi:hypothetical protein
VAAILSTASAPTKSATTAPASSGAKLATTTRPVGPRKTPLEVAEKQRLVRIANLAASVMVSLRQPDRSSYDSERELRGLLEADGVQFTTADLAPALALVDALGWLQRPAVGPSMPRPGRLPDAPTEDAPTTGEHPIAALKLAILPVLAGRGRYPDEAVLSEWLEPWLLMWRLTTSEAAAYAIRAAQSPSTSDRAELERLSGRDWQRSSSPPQSGSSF